MYFKKEYFYIICWCVASICGLASPGLQPTQLAQFPQRLPAQRGEPLAKSQLNFKWSIKISSERTFASNGISLKMWPFSFPCLRDGPKQPTLWPQFKEVTPARQNSVFERPPESDRHDCANRLIFRCVHPYRACTITAMQDTVLWPILEVSTPF